LDHVAGSQHLEQIAFSFSIEADKPGDAREHDVYGVIWFLLLFIYDRVSGKLPNPDPGAQGFQFA
jgi:hypothetical protein